LRVRALLAGSLALAALLLAATTNAGAPQRWHPDERAARAFARDRAGEISFAAIGPGGGMHAFHPGRTAPMASTFKVMLLATYLRQHSVRHRSLHHADTSLLGPMIKRSDSVAATRVRDIVGVPAIKRLARDAHLRKFKYNPVWGLSRDSARDQARFMYRLERYIPRPHRRYAFHLLGNIVPSQRWGIGEVNVRHWKLFFKGGWGSGTGAVDHQIALLRSHGERISLAILTTSDPSHAYGKRTLKKISRKLLRGLPRAGTR
jgi:hypothetical protein